MRITTKIYFLTVVVLTLLIVNLYYGISQLNIIRQEFQAVTQHDIALLDFVLKLRQYQAEKTILFERLLRIAEELEYEETVPARKEHLLDLVKFSKQGFNDLRQKTGEEILKTKQLLDEGIRQHAAADQAQYIKQFEAILERTEKSEIAYEDFLIGMSDSILDGKFQLSIGDIDQAQARQQKLVKQFNELLNQVHQLTKESLTQATLIEEKLSKMMWRLLLGIMVSLIVIILIIRGIARPLKNMTRVAEQIGAGNFDFRLPEASKNEIGEVNRALNAMSAKLAEAREQLELKNQELARQLTITEEQKVDLEKVNKELDNFAHTVSHDLRSPLMGIMSYCSILESQYRPTLDERGQKCINRIRHGSERLNRMIDDLLALTRIARIKNPYESADVAAIVRDVVERLEYKIREGQIILTIKNELPTMVCDRIKLGEVFLNLVSNAIKFSSKRDQEGNLVSGQSQAAVDIGYRDIADEYEFYVKDNGIGIAKESHHEVFDIFKRLDTAEQYEGTGAGLSIVKTIIDDHGGRIWIDSDTGRGAAFYFTIPKSLRKI